MSIKSELNKLNEVDVYSFMLFVLFKVRDVPEYSSLSELAYALDKNSLLNLCEYFGGTTIKIPTIDELENIIYTLLLYQKVEVDNIEFCDAIKSLHIDKDKEHQVKILYRSVSDIMKGYDFSSR